MEHALRVRPRWPDVPIRHHAGYQLLHLSCARVLVGFAYLEEIGCLLRPRYAAGAPGPRASGIDIQYRAT